MNPTSNTYNEVYYIESVGAPGYSSIAIAPRIPSEHVISWRNNSGRGDRVVAASIDRNEAPNKIVVHIDELRTLILHKITLELYNKNVKERLWGKPEFNTENELKDHFLKSDFS